MRRSHYPATFTGVPAALRRLKKSLKSRRFPADEERLFEGFYADRFYPQARFGVAFGFFAWSSFIVWDVLGFPALLPELAMIRFGVVAPVIGWLWWIAARHPERFKARMQFYLAAAPAAVILGLLLMMAMVHAGSSDQAFHLFWPAFTGLYFFQYAFLGMRFRPASALGISSLGLVSVAGLANRAEYHALGSALSQLAILNVLGMAICARLEIQERMLFRLRQRHHRQVCTARRERTAAQTVRDEAMLDRARAEAAMRLARADRAKLAEAVAERERFFSAAYHDLQQPLSIIGLYSRLAKNKLETASPSAILPDLTIIEGAGRDIALMFKGVRETFEIGRTEPHIETLDLNAILDEIEREFRDLAEQKNLAFRLRKRVRPPQWVRSDRMLLKRALSNLAGNAVKYTEQGSVVIRAVGLNGRIRIDVRDTGIGIPPEFQARIFDEYFQIPPPGAGRKPGLGLGLAIVRQVERNLPGHRLGFVSRPGRGSCFSLYVPAASPPPRSAEARIAPLPPLDEALESKYIVIVEDEIWILDGLIQTLRRAGCIVEGVDSAKTARMLFSQRDRCPDALITDWRLGEGETGQDVALALRERFEWADEVPILFITGDLTAEPALAGFEGPHAVYRKPIDLDALLAKLRGLMQTRPVSPPADKLMDASAA